MKKIQLMILIVLGFASTTSCDKDFEEINTNPNAAITVPSGLLVGDVVRNAGNILYSTFVGGDMGACWAQHFSKVQYNDEARYIPRPAVIQDLIWEGFYEDVISDAKSIQTIALTEENATMQAVGLTMQAYGYSVLTDMFGDIPFSEAVKFDEGIFQPKYDSQEAVYDGILAMLDEANTLFNQASGELNASSDILYDGDASGWQKFANSLKFRCLMRISGKKDVSVELKDIVENRPVFTSNADEAKIIYLSADPNANPIYETVVFGPRNEWKVNSTLIDFLTSLSDPRLGVCAQPLEDGSYFGKPSGLTDVPSPTYNINTVSSIGLHYLEATAPGYFMSYSELQFLMAEAAERGLIGGDAATFYNSGIHASFMANGLSQEDYDAYVGQSIIAYSSGTGLKLIAEQNWIGLFAQGVEAWTEYRRTGYPQLTPALEGAIDQIPSRYTYPVQEQSVNKANYEAAVGSQGADALTTDVWWMN